jgi:hypothetical protein
MIAPGTRLRHREAASPITVILNWRPTPCSARGQGLQTRMVSRAEGRNGS